MARHRAGQEFLCVALTGLLVSVQNLSCKLTCLLKKTSPSLDRSSPRLNTCLNALYVMFYLFMAYHNSDFSFSPKLPLGKQDWEGGQGCTLPPPLQIEMRIQVMFHSLRNLLVSHPGRWRCLRVLQPEPWGSFCRCHLIS